MKPLLSKEGIGEVTENGFNPTLPPLGKGRDSLAAEEE